MLGIFLGNFAYVHQKNNYQRSTRLLTTTTTTFLTRLQGENGNEVVVVVKLAGMGVKDAMVSVNVCKD